VAFGLLFVLAAVLLRVAWALRRPRRALAVGLAIGACGVVAGALVHAPSAHVLRKTIALLLMPLGLIWLAVVVSAAVAFETRRRRLAAGLGLLALALGVAGNPLVGRWLIHGLEGPFEHIDPMQRGPYEAVFVLGGGATRDQTGGIALDDAADRVILAVRLVRAGLADRLVASGPWVKAADGTIWSYPQLVAELWVELGVPRDRIVVLAGPATTSDEARAYAELLARTGWTRLGVVTSAFHMRRGLANLERNGLRMDPLPCDFRGSAGVRDLRGLIPQPSALLLAQIVLWEHLGSAVGR